MHTSPARTGGTPGTALARCGRAVSVGMAAGCYDLAAREQTARSQPGRV